MDCQPQAHGAHSQGSLEAEYGDHPPACARKPGRRQHPREPGEIPVELLSRTLGHFLPGFSRSINRLPDPRREAQCVYTQAHLLWLGILLFMMHLGSRRQLRFERLGTHFARNLERLCGQAGPGRVADPDTLAYYAHNADPAAIENLLAEGVAARLIRMRIFDSARLHGFLPVAVDGTQLKTFDHEPWPGCPYRTLANGQTQFFAYVLDAKLVTPWGMTLTLASEWLSNEGNKPFDKQDCESKAFARLVAKLHKRFPRTSLCLLLDGLYASQQVIRLIESRRWKYIITFKEGSMPERFAEATSLRGLQRANRLQIKQDGVGQHISWVLGLPVAEFWPNVLFCLETARNGKQTRFVWLTNFHLTKSNAAQIANKGGRLRWKIENEGFNVPKNNGYEMEHAYSKHPGGIRIFYILMQIAYALTQLILHGSLIRSMRKTFGSAKNFARRLAESLRNHPLPDRLPMPGQIRLEPP